jgi:replicative DNA helicase
MALRSLPCHVEAERSVLGILLLAPRLHREASAVLTAEDFYAPAHVEVFRAMGSLSQRGIAIDVITLEAELTARGTLASLAGGIAYLGELASSPPVAENWAHWARIVSEKARLRKLIAACGEAMELAYTASESGEIIETLSYDVAKLATWNASQLRRVGDIAGRLIHEFEERARGGDKSLVTGIRTGIDRLDEMTCGLRPGQLVVVAADTSGGKTALAQQVGINCIRNGGCCLNFNLEMTADELTERAFVHMGEVNSHLLRTGQITRDDFKRLTTVGQELYRANYYVEDESRSASDIAAKALAWRAKHPDDLGLVIVDYLQLVDVAIGKGESVARALGQVAKNLKGLAKSLKVPIILVSQLNRSAMREQREPRRDDLKESGDIEQSADVIVLIHNGAQTEDGEVDLLLAKNRGGMRGKVQAHWVGRHYAFRNPG